MTQAIAEIAGTTLLDPERFLRNVAEPCRPVILRDVVRHWPVVEAARRSAATMAAYLARFDNGRQVEVFFGATEIAGKYFYDKDMTGFNFDRRRMTVAAALEAIIGEPDRHSAETVYMGSVPTGAVLPGFASENTLPFIAASVEPRIWLGHASNVSAHYDSLDNVACVIAGSRRFTLYPPEWIGKLYVGPIDNTMAGQPVSLAASSPPDDERFPLFQGLRDQAFIADLEAGDALYMPKLWWHQVESRGSVNGLVNYWWDAFSAGPDAPYTALLLAMIAISERPERERSAWKSFFDHYVFRTDGHPLAHLPEEKHGLLGPLRPQNYGRIRAHVMQVLRGG